MELSSRILSIACASTVLVGLAVHSGSPSDGTAKHNSLIATSRKPRPIETADFGILQAFGDLDHHASVPWAPKMLPLPREQAAPVYAQPMASDNDSVYVDPIGEDEPVTDSAPPNQSSDDTNDNSSMVSDRPLTVSNDLPPR